MVVTVHLSTNQSAQSKFLGGKMELRRTVHTMRISDGHSGLIQVRATGS